MSAAEGESRGREVPPSLLRYRFRADGSAAAVVVNRWVDDVFEGVRCRNDEADDESESPLFDAVITWSSAAFTVRITGDRDGPDLKVTIAPNGALGNQPRECSP